MPKISVVSINVAKSKCDSLLLLQMQKLALKTKNDPGVIEFEIFQNSKLDRCYVFVEKWESREALESHFKTAHLIEFRRASQPLLEHKEVLILDQYPTQ